MRELSVFYIPKSYWLDLEQELLKLQQIKRNRLGLVQEAREQIAKLEQKKQEYEGAKIGD